MIGFIHTARQFRILCFSIFFFSFVSQAWALPPETYLEAKKMAKSIWAEHPDTLYCGCQYDNRLNVLAEDCSLIRSKRHRIWWEHIVPAHWLGKHLSCWKQKSCYNEKGEKVRGRNCCLSHSELFNRMHNDLHNLVPAIDVINEARSNYRFGVFTIENPSITKQYYMGCPIIIDEVHRTVQPREEVQGLIARTHLYMAKQYPFGLSKSQEKLFKAWNKAYPPSEWEKKWDQKVADVQGNHNPYIAQYQKYR